MYIIQKVGENKVPNITYKNKGAVTKMHKFLVGL